MGLYIDLAVIVIVLIFGIVGLVKGFFKSIISLLGFFGSLALAIAFRNEVCALINRLFNLQVSIESFLSVKFGEISPLLTTPMENSSEMITAINSTNLNSVLKGLFCGLATKADFTIPISVADIVVEPIASICVTILAVLALFLIIRLAVFILDKTIGKLIKDGKAFSGLNRFLGFLFGLCKGTIFLFVIMAIASGLSLIPSVAEFVNTNIETTYITKYGYNVVNEIIVKELSKLIGSDKTNDEGAGEDDGVNTNILITTN